MLQHKTPLYYTFYQDQCPAAYFLFGAQVAKEANQAPAPPTPPFRMRAGPAADVLHLGLGKLPRARGTFSLQWDKKAETGAEQGTAHLTCALPVSGQPTWLLQLWCFRAQLSSAPLLQEKGWQEQSEEGQTGGQMTKRCLAGSKPVVWQLRESSLVPGRRRRMGRELPRQHQGTAWGNSAEEGQGQEQVKCVGA